MGAGEPIFEELGFEKSNVVVMVFDTNGMFGTGREGVPGSEIAPGVGVL